MKHSDGHRLPSATRQRDVRIGAGNLERPPAYLHGLAGRLSSLSQAAECSLVTALVLYCCRSFENAKVLAREALLSIKS